MTGLDAIRRLNAVPEVLFIEVPTLLVSVDQNLLSSVFLPFYSRIQSDIPSLRLSRNWIVLFYRWLTTKRRLDPDKLRYPAQSLKEWNELMAPRFSANSQPYSNLPPIKARVAEVAAQVRALRERGTRVIFYNPVDPLIRSWAPTKDITAEIKAQMPEVEYIDAPDAQFPIYRLDGLHFVDVSGLQFFEYLMKYAGLPFTRICQIRPRQTMLLENRSNMLL
jgi:hypothetical protein